MIATPLTSYAGYDVGDHVFITARPRPDSVHWVIRTFYKAAEGRVYAAVWSPHSSRNRLVPVEKLSLHSKGEKK